MILLLLIIAACQPTIQHESVRFCGGTVVHFDKQSLLAKQQQEYGEAKYRNVSAYAFLATDVSRIVVSTTTELDEDAEYRLEFYSFDGKLVGKYKDVGDDAPIIRAESHRAFFAGVSSHFQVDGSELVNFDGKVVKRIGHRESAAEAGASDDGKVFWLLFFEPVNGKPHERLDIFDSNGKPLKSIESDSEQTFHFDYGGKTYPIRIPEPQLPG